MRDLNGNVEHLSAANGMAMTKMQTNPNSNVDVDQDVDVNQDVKIPANVDAFLGDYESYGQFTTAVKEKLIYRNRRPSACANSSASYMSSDTTTYSSSVNNHDNFALIKTPISSNKEDQLAYKDKLNMNMNFNTNTTTFLTDKEALEEINLLIEFEQKYSKRLNNLVVEEEEVSDATGHSTRSDNNNDDNDGSGDDDTVTQDLLKADAITLRRFVLHFAYLFSVRKDEILGKMNDLYVFSHEATDMINNIKKRMNLKNNCPIHTVARKVVDLIERDQALQNQ